MPGPVNRDVSVRPTAGVNNQLKPFSEDTRRVQVEINQAIAEGKLPGPLLKEDGIEGPKTRAKLQEFQALKTPAAPEAPKTKAPEGDRRQAQDPTVGEYVEGQIREFGQELKEDAKLSAIMLTPGFNVVAGVIMTRHMNQARERIAKLPMDPDGHWKQEAAKIMNEERHAAREEILAVPGKAAQGVVDGVNTAVEAVDKTVDQAVEAVDKTVDQAVEAVDKTVDQAVEAVDKTIDQGVDAAKDAWNGVTGKAAEAWDYAKVAVPRAFKEIASDAQVAVIMANPLFAAPSAIILKNHMAKAYDRIMKLPMDPAGKWKQEAARIRDQEQEAAKKEILALPGRALDTVVDTATGVYESAKKGVLLTGAWIEHKVQEEIEETKQEVKAVRRGIGGFFGSIAGGIQRFGKWIAGE